MKVSLSRLGMGLLICGVYIPSYIFFAGQKLLNVLYLLNAILVVFMLLLQSTHRIRCEKTRFGNASVYLLSLVLYGVQALYDSDSITALHWMTSSAVIIYSMTRYCRNTNSFYYCVDGCIWISAPFMVLGIVEAVTSYNIFQHIPLVLETATFYQESRLGVFRIASVFGHPIFYCVFLSILLALILYRLNCAINANKRRVFRVIYFLGFVNAILTVSRSAMLVLIAQQLVLYQICGAKWLTPKKLLIAMFGIGILLLSDLFGMSVLDRIVDMLNMLLQVFGLGKSEYSTNFSSKGYDGVVGDRFLLFGWVVATVGSKLWLGMGTNAVFSYMATNVREKTSIENYFLKTFFQHGIIGLVIAVIGLVALVSYLVKGVKTKQVLKTEGKLTFNTTMLVIVIGYIACLFMSGQAGEARMFYICVGLLIGYNNICRKQSEDKF